MMTSQVTILTGELSALKDSEPEGDETYLGESDGDEFDAQTALGRSHAEPTWQSLAPLSVALAYLLLPLGLLGVHQFYLRNWWRGGLYLLTGGCLGVGLMIDLVTLRRQVDKANALRALGIR